MAELEKQPSLESQREQKEIESDKPFEVELRGRKIKLFRSRNKTISKITDIMLNEKDELKVSTKTAVAMYLNGYWSIKLRYWFVWRWWYYVRQYSQDELSELINAGKKKVDAEHYYLNTILLTEMKDTIAHMTREEVERFRAAQITAQDTV